VVLALWPLLGAWLGLVALSVEGWLHQRGSCSLSPIHRIHRTTLGGWVYPLEHRSTVDSYRPVPVPSTHRPAISRLDKTPHSARARSHHQHVRTRTSKERP